MRSLQDHESKVENINEQFETKFTVGERVADVVASFGGSWKFIIGFGAFIAVWALINAILPKPWDPYPFILLNLCLSMLASIQAPVIMMSQNRQDAKDRLKSDYDYKVNMLAELEVRRILVKLVVLMILDINAKLDQILLHHWPKLLEIQEIQTSLINNMNRQTVSRKFGNKCGTQCW